MQSGVSRMNDPMDYLAPVLKANSQLGDPGTDDYIDAEGLLMCGKCHTRRQMVIKVPAPNGQQREMTVYRQCDCRKAAEEAEAERKRKADEAEAFAKLLKELKGQSLMDERTAGHTFDNFQQTPDNARNLKLCRRYAEHFDEMLEKNQGLLMYGPVGTGKSFSAACIANYLLNAGISVIMTSFVKLLDAMQGSREDDQALIDRMNKVKLLIIDDLGAERGSDYTLEKVYNIIDSRYRAKLPIILTTNLDLEQMKADDDIRYERIYDRIFELCYPMLYTGKSWRKTEANRRFKDMRAFLEGEDG